MKLDLEIDTEKLSDEQLEKLRIFLISVGMWKDELGTTDLKIPKAWEDKKKRRWWPFLKLFFDGCEIKHFDPIGRITLLLSGPDLDKFFPLLQQIFEKGNPPVDITLNYPWMQVNQTKCEKCKALTDYLVAIPNRANYKNDVEFRDAQVQALEFKPTTLKCKDCGELID